MYDSWDIDFRKRDFVTINFLKLIFKQLHL